LADHYGFSRRQIVVSQKTACTMAADNPLVVSRQLSQHRVTVSLAFSPVISLADDAKYQSRMCVIALIVSPTLPWTEAGVNASAKVEAVNVETACA
jgi:hypothetical protein